MRLDRLIEFVPYPVTTGFTAAASPWSSRPSSSATSSGSPFRSFDRGIELARRSTAALAAEGGTR